MTGVRDVTQLCFSFNLAGIVANKIEQSFYSVYSYSGIESIEHALKSGILFKTTSNQRGALALRNNQNFLLSSVTDLTNSYIDVKDYTTHILFV